MKFFVVFRSDEMSINPDGYSGVCLGLFFDLDDALREAADRLVDGYHVSIEHGETSQAEWDALEEVPDDFNPAAHTT